MNETVVKQHQRFKEFIERLSPVELESAKKAILECGEEKLRADYEGERKACENRFCPRCEANRSIFRGHCTY